MNSPSSTDGVSAAPPNHLQRSRRTVLITGTSSGIGLATAVAAAEQGWTVIATMRNLEKGRGLRAAATRTGVTLDVRVLEVTDPSSVHQCIDGVIADYGRLDAVVNNAGAAHVGTIETDDIAAVRACIEVNFFGVVHLAQAAMPYLRTTQGRLLTISSVGGIIGQPFNEAYCAAKFAVEGFMEALAPVGATVGVRVGVIEPGAVASEFVNSARLNPTSMIAEAGPYAPALRTYLERVATQFADNAQPASEVADVIMRALNADSLPFRTQTSSGAQQFAAMKLSDVDGSVVQKFTAAWLG